MRGKLAFFVVASLGLLVARAPAQLVDALVARATDGDLRLQQAEGSLWHGHGTLASRDAGGRSASPWLPVAWNLDAGALMRLAIGWTFTSNGSPLGSVSAGPHGVTLAGVALHAPAGTALAAIPHPVARAGWHGDLTVDAPRWHCPPDGRCSGEARLLWRGARSDLFPGRAFGDYEVRVAAHDGSLRFAIATLAGEIQVSGQGEAPFGAAPRVDGTISGDPAFLARLPAVAGGAARASGPPGRYEIHWPPR